MPNYNFNELTIIGTKGNIRKFLTKHIDDCGNFNFETIIPSPKNIEDCEPQYVLKDAEDARKHYLAYEGERPWFNWYSWQCENWGTKWNSLDTFVSDLDESFSTESENEEVEFIFSFDTAWNPPMPIFKKLIDLHPELEITCFYIEEGMGFCGVYGKDRDEYYEAAFDLNGYRRCTIKNNYYDQDYWDEYDEQYREDEDN